jgi:hypothetical protein
MKEGGSDNKAVRYHAYKLYTRMRHGVLQHFVTDNCLSVSVVRPWIHGLIPPMSMLVFNRQLMMLGMNSEFILILKCLMYVNKPFKVTR